MGEAQEMQSSSFRAVGLLELVRLQHNVTNSQRASEKPKMFARRGLPGCSPRFSTGKMNVRPGM